MREHRSSCHAEGIPTITTASKNTGTDCVQSCSLISTFMRSDIGSSPRQSASFVKQPKSQAILNVARETLYAILSGTLASRQGAEKSPHLFHWKGFRVSEILTNNLSRLGAMLRLGHHGLLGPPTKFTTLSFKNTTESVSRTTFSLMSEERFCCSQRAELSLSLAFGPARRRGATHADRGGRRGSETGAPGHFPGPTGSLLARP